MESRLCSIFLTVPSCVCPSVHIRMAAVGSMTASHATSALPTICCSAAWNPERNAQILKLINKILSDLKALGPNPTDHQLFSPQAASSLKPAVPRTPPCSGFARYGGERMTKDELKGKWRKVQPRKACNTGWTHENRNEPMEGN